MPCEIWDEVLAFRPDLLLVSAGFDAYAEDPITAMTLEIEDFATLGSWLGEARFPVAAILEGGYSGDLPLLDRFVFDRMGRPVLLILERLERLARLPTHRQTRAARAAARRSRPK